MARITMAFDPEMLARARQRASEIGISLDQYISNLIESDISRAQATDISCIFNLGSSDGSNIAANKDSMIAEAFEAARRRPK